MGIILSNISGSTAGRSIAVTGSLYLASGSDHGAPDGVRPGGMREKGFIVFSLIVH